MEATNYWDEAFLWVSDSVGEAPDLNLQLVICNAWSAHLLGNRGYGRVFVSASGYAELGVQDLSDLNSMQARLEKAGLHLTLGDSRSPAK